MKTAALSRTGRFVALSLLCAALAACGALPDVSPFTQSTAMLASSVRSAGDAAVAEVALASEIVLPQNQAALQNEAKRLDHAWSKHAVALDAAADYARSLQAVVDAAESGDESVRAVTGAAEQFADTVGLHFGEAASIVGDALRLAHRHIAIARGRATLREAMVELTPAVDKLASVMDASLTDLEAIVESAAQLQINGLRGDHQVELSFRQEVLKDRAALYEQGWAGLSDQEKDQLAELEAAIAATDSWHNALEADLEAVARRRAAQLHAIAAIQRGVSEWAATHAEIRAVLERRGVSDTSALAMTIVEVRQLVERARDL